VRVGIEVQVRVSLLDRVEVHVGVMVLVRVTAGRHLAELDEDGENHSRKKSKTTAVTGCPARSAAFN
jgi:hypothetical protein